MPVRPKPEPITKREVALSVSRPGFIVGEILLALAFFGAADLARAGLVFWSLALDTLALPALGLDLTLAFRAFAFTAFGFGAVAFADFVFADLTVLDLFLALTAFAFLAIFVAHPFGQFLVG